MRIPIPWHLRQAQRLSNSPKLVCSQLHTRGILPTTAACIIRSCFDRLVVPHFSARCVHTEASTTTTPTLAASSTYTTSTDKYIRWTGEHGATIHWRDVKRLNRYLPRDLEVKPPPIPHDADDVDDTKLPLDAYELQQIILRARAQKDIELLLWLVEHNYQKTAVWLMKAILNLSHRAEKVLPLQSPSNLTWHVDLFNRVEAEDRVQAQENKPHLARCSAALPIGYEFNYEAKQVDSDAQARHWLNGHIWESLGIMMIKSAGPGSQNLTSDYRQATLLVLGHIHSLGALPDDIYAGAPKHCPSFVQRPPILNLVSARILTALSDVAWRQQQDDAISEAALTGMSMKEISQSVPGGRFRLKVRPLGPEVWLELILWCCIESQHASAALAIVKALGSRTENPWFAIRWTSPRPDEHLSTVIDWNRLKLRHGGTTGLVEGYSREKPFVDVPEHTISVEVVLALVEALVTDTVPASLDKEDEFSEYSTLRNHRHLRKTLADIEDVMTFLEPHDLPLNYFDYLHSRLEQDGLFDMSSAPQDLHDWCTRMKCIRTLAKGNSEKVVERNLELPRIYSNGLLHLGLEHQAMHGLVQIADIHRTLAVFNEIQETVDKKKVASVVKFLEHQPISKDQESPRGLPNHDFEFIKSHGQIPLYKLAAFLNLLSTTNLVGLGRWLLFGEDVDGAMIPQETWGYPCMAAAVYRFAATSGDPALLDLAMYVRNRNDGQQSIRMLRTLVDANINLLQLGRVKSHLVSLQRSQEGGFGLSNLVHIAALLLRLEKSTDVKVSDQDKLFVRQTAEGVLHDMLRGSFNSKGGGYNLAQKRLFKQQVGQVLSVMRYLKPSRISDLAETYLHDFPRGNLPLLPAKDFNVLLAAAIDCHGVTIGQRMWWQFCTGPNLSLDEGDLTYLAKDQPPAEASDTDAISKIPLVDSNTTEESFKDPFFPTSPVLAEPTSERSSDSSLQGSGEASSSQRKRNDAVTKPNFQTLRLIARAVAAGNRSFKDRASKRRWNRHMWWVRSMFRRYGITDRNVVDQELEVPLNDLNEDVSQETEPTLEAAKERDFLAQVSTNDLTAGAPVSEMWIPISQRKERLC